MNKFKMEALHVYSFSLLRFLMFVIIPEIREMDGACRKKRGGEILMEQRQPCHDPRTNALLHKIIVHITQL